MSPYIPGVDACQWLEIVSGEARKCGKDVVTGSCYCYDHTFPAAHRPGYKRQALGRKQA